MENSSISKIMGLFLHKNLILTSQVTFLADGGVNVTYKDYARSLDNMEYIKLILFHYAKMMMIIPRNFSGIIPFLKAMNYMTLSDDFRKSIILDFDNLEFKLFCYHPINIKQQDRTYVTNLFISSDNNRYIKTKIPLRGPTFQALLSVKELIEFLTSKLSPLEIAIMKDALWNMTNEYINGVNFHALKQSRIIPESCLLNAINKNKI